MMLIYKEIIDGQPLYFEQIDKPNTVYSIDFNDVAYMISIFKKFSPSWFIWRWSTFPRKCE